MLIFLSPHRPFEEFNNSPRFSSSVAYPFVSTQKSTLAVALGAHTILVLNQAGWYFSTKLRVPDNITLLPLAWKIMSIGMREWAYRCLGFKTPF